MADVIEISAEVRERELRLTSIPMMPSGSRNHLRIRITFDAEWEGTTKTLVAYRDLSHPYHVPLGLDGMALIPHEVLAEQGVVYLGVFGVAGDQRITSTIVRYGVNEGAVTDGLQPSDPTPEMWDQLISAVNEVRQAAESAMRDAQTAAQGAQQSEQAAAGSATQADGAATRAETAADTATTSAQDAETAKTDAQKSATRAEQAAGNMSTAVTQAQDAARAAQQSATQAQDHAKSAGDSAASAAQAQQGATDAETAAQNSAQSAGEQANAAATSAQQAQQSQTAAAESATSAQESAAEATKQASASEASAVRAETAATEVEQSAQQIAGAIDRLAIHDTAAGNPTVIRDGADWQMEGLRVYGQSEQVTTTGAQMFDASTRIVGGIIDNGVQASNSRYACSDYIPIPDGTSHLYQFGGAMNQRGFYDADKAYLSKPTATNVVDVPEGAKYIRITSGVDKQAMADIMLCTGNTSKPYEPYTGGKPAPSPEYPQDVMSKTVDQIVVTGSNLLPLDDYIETATNKYFCKNTGLLLRAGVKYVFSCDGGPTNLYVNNKTTGETVVKAYNKSEAPYTPSEDGLYYFMVYHENGVSGFNNFRLNVGLKMPYEPYHAQIVKLSIPVTLRGVPVTTGGTVTIDGKQYISDVIIDKNGVIGVKRRTMTTKLAVAAMNASERLPGWQKTGLVDKMLNPVQYIFCSHLHRNQVSINYVGDVVFLERTEMTQTEWKTNHPDLVMDFVFPIKEPVFEPLPEPDQRAIRALRTYHGNTVVTTGAHTEVDYIADPKLYIDGKVTSLVTAYMQSIPTTIPLLDEEVVDNGG